jgi:hypothetical protein
MTPKERGIDPKTGLRVVSVEFVTGVVVTLKVPPTLEWKSLVEHCRNNAPPNTPTKHLRITIGNHTYGI